MSEPGKNLVAFQHAVSGKHNPLCPFASNHKSIKKVRNTGKSGNFQIRIISDDENIPKARSPRRSSRVNAQSATAEDLGKRSRKPLSINSPKTRTNQNQMRHFHLDPLPICPTLTIGLMVHFFPIIVPIRVDSCRFVVKNRFVEL